MKPHPRIRKTIKWTRAAPALLIASLLAGCKPSGPASTKTTSSGLSTIAERARFLHDYVTFRRTYETLDFHIEYHNNGGGMMAAPSDWDIRLIATVPAAEIPQWIPAGVSSSPTHHAQWLESVPTTLDVSGVNEWYVDGKRVVGIDRTHRVVVYRLTTSPD